MTNSISYSPNKLGSQLILTKDEKKRGGGERFIKRKTKN